MTVPATRRSITSFSGPYSWASSFYEAPFVIPDTPHITWPTREHYFQAAKATNGADLDWILSAPTASEAKKRGRRIGLPRDWDDRKRTVMMQGILVQFSCPYLPLRGLLAATGSAILVEGNTWGDDYWGAVPRDRGTYPDNAPVWAPEEPETRWLVGCNWLGRCLMMARELLA